MESQNWMSIIDEQLLPEQSAFERPSRGSILQSPPSARLTYRGQVPSSRFEQAPSARSTPEWNLPYRPSSARSTPEWSLPYRTSESPEWSLPYRTSPRSTPESPATVGYSSPYTGMGSPDSQATVAYSSPYARMSTPEQATLAYYSPEGPSPEGQDSVAAQRAHDYIFTSPPSRRASTRLQSTTQSPQAQLSVVTGQPLYSSEQYFQ